eukprot:6208433-Pleurochrysis_carterae.AAC.5
MEGTQRTSVRVKSTIRFCDSRTESGRPPTATQGRGLPSTPDTVSVQGRTLVRSPMLRAWRSLRRAEQVATRARGLEAIRRSVHAVRVDSLLAGVVSVCTTRDGSSACGTGVRQGLGGGPAAGRAKSDAFANASAGCAALRSETILR